VIFFCGKACVGLKKKNRKNTNFFLFSVFLSILNTQQRNKNKTKTQNGGKKLWKN